MERPRPIPATFLDRAVRSGIGGYDPGQPQRGVKGKGGEARFTSRRRSREVSFAPRKLVVTEDRRWWAGWCTVHRWVPEDLTERGYPPAVSRYVQEWRVQRMGAEPGDRSTVRCLGKDDESEFLMAAGPGSIGPWRPGLGETGWRYV